MNGLNVAVDCDDFDSWMEFVCGWDVWNSAVGLWFWTAFKRREVLCVFDLECSTLLEVVD